MEIIKRVYNLFYKLLYIILNIIIPTKIKNISITPYFFGSKDQIMILIKYGEIQILQNFDIPKNNSNEMEDIKLVSKMLFYQINMALELNNN